MEEIKKTDRFENRERAPGAAGDDKGFKKNLKRPLKRKVCVFCQEKTTHIDFKDINKLKKFTTEKGKMVPKRMSGTCTKHQIALANAIKVARQMALLPFVSE
jgi:small subunit ribosomal protein S18